jgi:hypothetical protein
VSIAEAVTLISAVTAAITAAVSLVVAIGNVSKLADHGRQLDHVETLVNGASQHINELVAEKARGEGLAEGLAFTAEHPNP